MKVLHSGRLILAFLFFSGALLQGCKKQAFDKSNNPASDSVPTTSSETTIRTPFGPRPASEVHYIEDGYHLNWSNGHLLKVQTASGKITRDFGVQKPLASLKAPNIVVTGSEPGKGIIKPALNSGWITYGINAFTATYFTTTWTVPTNPVGTDNQLLYLFNGMDDGILNNGHILQPVLQYGSNGAWGGYYWTIANWYASCQNCAAYYSGHTTVNQYTPIVGVIRQTGSSGNSYSYTSTFYQYGTSNAYNSLPVTNVPQLVNLYETMESYGMQQPNDYPADLSCPMYQIQALNGSVNAVLNWTALNPGTDPTVGQHTLIASNASPGGEVDLYFHYPPPPPANAVISIQNSSVNTIGIGFVGGSYPSITAGPGGSSTQITPGVYNVVFNSGGGKCYYEIFDSGGQVIASDFSDQPVVTLSNINFTAGNYSIYIGNAGD
jgi:hypothetical protein